MEGGIVYDAIINGITSSSSHVMLLDDYRNQHARSLGIHLNGEPSVMVDQIIATLEQHRDSSNIPLVMNRHRKGYEYQLRTNGAWSFSISEKCLFGPGKYLDCEQFHLEY